MEIERRLANVRFRPIADIGAIGEKECMSHKTYLRLLGWGVLLLGLPLALMAALHPPNEYKAIFGGNSLDCDGPFGTYVVAVPALILYGSGLLINGLRWRKRSSLIVAFLCLVICGAVVANVARAVVEEREQEAACSAR